MKTLRDTLHEINLNEDDRDICVDGYDCIAVVAPATITPEGEKEFGRALNAKCEHDLVEDADDSVCEEANTLLFALAGYCSDRDYKRWFEGPEAKEI